MTKLVVQIPALNEAQTLPKVLAAIPRTIAGVDDVQVIVIDDGSTDGTAQVAIDNGADAVIRHRSNRGLSRAFITGIEFALALGANIIVNTDGDNQYPGEAIPELIKPILNDRADMAICDRQPQKNPHFSALKRRLETLGSAYLAHVSHTTVNDAASGFRAFSRFAALNLQVYNPYSYTLETLIQAGKKHLNIAQVPIKTNAAERKSRLHKGILHFIAKQGGAILRSYVLYQPLRSFLSLGMTIFLCGLVFLIRFLYFFIHDGTTGHVQSVSFGGSLVAIGVFIMIIGFLADSIRANRIVQEELIVNKRDSVKIQDLKEIHEFEGQPVYTKAHLFPKMDIPEFIASRKKAPR